MKNKMKRTLYAVALLLAASSAFAQKSLDVTVARAGTLSSYIADADKYSVTSLTVKGELNGDDIRLIRDIAGGSLEADASEEGVSTPGKLQVLDMSGARIVRGGDVYYAMNLTTSTDTVGTSMFKNCRSLESIVLPRSTKYIGNVAFSGCKALRTVDMPSGVAGIGAWAFDGSGIETIVLPQTMKSVQTSTFSDCSRLVSVTIPEGVTAIGSYAFSGCSALRNVTLPLSLKTIQPGAFRNGGLRSVELPSALSFIGIDAFASCAGMESVTISGDLTGFGRYAFEGCDGIKAIHFKTCTPPTFTSDINPFYNIDIEKCTLYVPEGCADVYRSDALWSSFKNIVEENPTAIYGIKTGTDRTETVYDMTGRKLPTCKKGLNIIRTKDGKTVKLLVK